MRGQGTKDVHETRDLGLVGESCKYDELRDATQVCRKRIWSCMLPRLPKYCSCKKYAESERSSGREGGSNVEN